MKATIKQISKEFSNGNFKFAYDYLTDDIIWNIAGDKILQGKKSVIEFCNKTAQYFLEVTTTFNMHNAIVDGDCVAIDGTAEFINQEGKSIHISSCDVYRFKNELLLNITSYCIVTGKIKLLQ
jgi:ketosteroid isomerase-like protein